MSTGQEGTPGTGLPVCSWRFFCPSFQMGSKGSQQGTQGSYTSSQRMCPKYQQTATPQPAFFGCWLVLPDLPNQSVDDLR